MTASANDPGPIPVTSLVFGFAPMLPLVGAAACAWALPMPWPDIALKLALIWGAAILIFVAGVRRGYGFGAPGASTSVEIITMLLYFVPGSLALVLTMYGYLAPALLLLIAGFALVAIIDRRAALIGDAPAYFRAPSCAADDDRRNRAWVLSGSHSVPHADTMSKRETEACVQYASGPI